MSTLYYVDDECIKHKFHENCIIYDNMEYDGKERFMDGYKWAVKDCINYIKSMPYSDSNGNIIIPNNNNTLEMFCNMNEFEYIKDINNWESLFDGSIFSITITDNLDIDYVKSAWYEISYNSPCDTTLDFCCLRKNRRFTRNTLSSNGTLSYNAMQAMSDCIMRSKTKKV